MANGIFREWLDNSEEEKKLIAFSGEVRPLIRDRLSSEISKNMKSISHDISSAFYDAYVGKKREADQAVTIWEIPLSPKPILFGKNLVNIGSAVLAYQLPTPDENEVNTKASALEEEERKKFIQDREKYFVDFLRTGILGDSSLNEIVDDLVHKLYSAIKDKETVQGPQAKVVWKGTVKSGKRFLGRIMIALKLPPKDEKELEKALQES